MEASTCERHRKVESILFEECAQYSELLNSNSFNYYHSSDSQLSVCEPLLCDIGSIPETEPESEPVQPELENAGEPCMETCGQVGASCTYCGSAGVCCLAGQDESTCKGHGGISTAVCILPTEYNFVEMTDLPGNKLIDCTHTSIQIANSIDECKNATLNVKADAFNYKPGICYIKTCVNDVIIADYSEPLQLFGLRFLDPEPEPEPEPEPVQPELENAGEACLETCGQTGAPCSFCGSAGVCCMAGQDELTCEGQGGISNPVCILPTEFTVDNFIEMTNLPGNKLIDCSHISVQVANSIDECKNKTIDIKADAFNYKPGLCYIKKCVDDIIVSDYSESLQLFALRFLEFENQSLSALYNGTTDPEPVQPELENAGEACLDTCGQSGAPCNYCGSAGVCCMAGQDELTCEGQGGITDPVCILPTEFTVDNFLEMTDLPSNKLIDCSHVSVQVANSIDECKNKTITIK
eukprot:Awhi_evm1s14428